MVSVAGVAMAWVAAPPSDQDSKVKNVSPWSAARPRPASRRIPTTLDVTGVVSGWPSSVTCRPGGVVARWSVETRGMTSRKVVWVRPPESLTVRWMRYQTLAAVSPEVGIVNEPVLRAAGRRGTNGWVCVSWWKSTRQVKALAGRVPSSVSVPVPA